MKDRWVLWLKVNSKLDRKTGCWIWLHFKRASYPKLRGRDVNRFTLGLVRQQDYACHTCDRKACVRPEHLYAGTAVTNGKDFAARGTRYTNPRKERK